MNETIMGYLIEDRKDNRPGRAGYVLTGKRGAKYYLLRTMSDPRVMFPVNSMMNTCSLKGNYWFTDCNGSLETIN